MFYYQVEYIDNETYKVVKDSGLVAASSYSAAGKKMVEYYGNEIISLYIEAWEDVISEEDLLSSLEEADLRK